MEDVILRADNLRAYYLERDAVVKAVDGVSFSLRRGSTLGIMGESGCGKTTVGLAVLRLIPHPGRIVGGGIFFEDREITRMSAEELRRLRGREISMIFQDPVSGLNPTLTVGTQVEEIITSHLSVPKKEARRMTVDALRHTGLPHPERLVEQYPFYLSGGMCQRVMIAIATVLNPQVIIADEPTAALDVTVQAAILEELERLKRDHGVATMLISHDMGIIAQMADEVAVMYAGRIVESGSVDDVFQRPRHPYTWALLSTRPRIDGPPAPLRTIRGAPPDLASLPDECPFLPRCPKAISRCRQEPAPALAELSPGHRAACFNPVALAPAD
jgi:oligopeptide/dipeptide ABC transporter ATP-binding protein